MMSMELGAFMNSVIFETHLSGSFTLNSSSGSIGCYFHTFGNNLGIKRKFHVSGNLDTALTSFTQKKAH